MLNVEKKEYLKWVLEKSSVCLVVSNTISSENFLPTDTKEIIYSEGIYDSCDIAIASPEAIAGATGFKDIEKTNFFLFCCDIFIKRIPEQKDEKSSNPLKTFLDLLISPKETIDECLLESEKKKKITVEILQCNIKSAWLSYYFFCAIKNNTNKKQVKENDKKAKDPYEILGISHGATVSDIKRARNEKIIKCHPDKIVHLDLDPDFTSLANQKTKEFNEAYSFLMSKIEEKT